MLCVERKLFVLSVILLNVVAPLPLLTLSPFKKVGTFLRGYSKLYCLEVDFYGWECSRKCTERKYVPCKPFQPILTFTGKTLQW